MMNTVEFVVTFKEGNLEPQQTRSFKVKEAAYAFAISIENDGGIAVVTQQYKQEPVANRTFGDF